MRPGNILIRFPTHGSPPQGHTEALQELYTEALQEPTEAPTGFPQDDLPYRLGDLKHQPGRVLCLWGDAGWGEIARSSKRAGRLDPQLVDASAELIRRHWAPDPSPSWVTFGPSLRNPELVGSFARELARQLGLPCIPAVRKMTDNKPQKEMENKFKVLGEAPSHLG